MSEATTEAVVDGGDGWSGDGGWSDGVDLEPVDVVPDPDATVEDGDPDAEDIVDAELVDEEPEPPQVDGWDPDAGGWRGPSPAEATEPAPSRPSGGGQQEHRPPESGGGGGGGGGRGVGAFRGGTTSLNPFRRKPGARRGRGGGFSLLTISLAPSLRVGGGTRTTNIASPRLGGGTTNIGGSGARRSGTGRSMTAGQSPSRLLGGDRDYVARWNKSGRRTSW